MTRQVARWRELIESCHHDFETSLHEDESRLVVVEVREKTTLVEA